MKFSPLSVVLLTLLPPSLSGTAKAAMVDFEAPYYTAASSFDGVDGWAIIDILGGSSVITPDAGGSGDTTVLVGSQSGRLSGAGSGGSAAIGRLFDPGPFYLADGTIVSGHMHLDETAGGSVEFFYSHSPFSAATPAGVAGRVGGNFYVFGRDGGSVDFFDSGIPSLSNVDYLLEIELDLDTQSFKAYATNFTAGGPRELLGNLSLAAATTITPEMYSESGHILVTRNYAVGVFDDLNVEGAAVGPPVDIPSGKVSFELPHYVRGASVIGYDNWHQALGSGTAVVINTNDVLENSQSMLVTAGERNVLQRNFGSQTTYEDGSIISARMKLLGSAAGEGQGQFFFSNDQTGLETPAGIIGVENGNFWIFGLRGGSYDDDDKGLDTGIPFAAGVDYLLEMQFDFTNQFFYSYVTNLTDAVPRTFLGAAEFRVDQGATIEPGDNTNSGYVLNVRNYAEVVYDEFNLEPALLPESFSMARMVTIPEPSLTVSLLGLLMGLIAGRRRTR